MKNIKKVNEFDIEENTTECDVSYRGGVLKVNVSAIFPEVADWDNGDEAIMGASQNYLGGGIAGRITSGAMFDASRLNKKQREVYEALAERIKQYFYELNAGGGDEYMVEEVNSYEGNQRLAVSGY